MLFLHELCASLFILHLFDIILHLCIGTLCLFLLLSLPEVPTQFPTRKAKQWLYICVPLCGPCTLQPLGPQGLCLVSPFTNPSSAMLLLVMPELASQRSCQHPKVVPVTRLSRRCLAGVTLIWAVIMTAHQTQRNSASRCFEYQKYLHKIWCYLNGF